MSIRICGVCNKEMSIIQPTPRNYNYNQFLGENTKVYICRNMGCPEFQKFMPGKWWKYKRQPKYDLLSIHN